MLTYMCNEKDENGNYFDDKDLIAHAGFLLFAAHDTTTSVLNQQVAKIIADQNLILIRGGIPGARGGLVVVRGAIKKNGGQKKK